MSTTASIDITLGRPYDVMEVINKFLANGWSYEDHGKITYLPLGDTDFDWDREDLNQFESIQHIMMEKIAKLETVGLALLNRNINSGGLFHFKPSESTIMILIEINRISISGLHVTDFSLYLSEILKNVPLSVTAIVCSDA